MVYKKLLEGIYNKIDPELEVRRYNLSDMISESYRVLYECKDGSNLQKVVESHLDDIRKNPSDIERLSRQLCTIKEVVRMTESGEIKDKDLILKSREKIDSRKPMRESTKPRKLKRANESSCDPEDEELLEDSDLTDEEVEELTKHLEEIRKKKGTAPKKEDTIEESTDGEEKLDDCNEASSFAKKVGDIYDEIYNNHTQSKRDWGSEYGTIGKDYPGDDHEALLDKIESIFDEYNCDSDDVTVCVDQLPIEGKKAIAKLLSIESYLEDSKRPRRKLKEDGSRSWRSRRSSSYGSNEMTTDDMRELASTLESLADDLETAGTYSIRLSPTTYSLYPPYIGTTEGFLSLSDTDKYFEDDDDEDYDESVKPRKLKRANESRSYKGLENFKKLSESKAFYKTFKKMHNSLKEGKALTRQEAISLYKAANSALTHLSVELEHNPEFLDTFRESTSLLSEDVNSLRESIARGKAPSKRTMNSLAKFSEALLYEADDEEDIDDLEPPIEDSEEEETPEDSNEFDQDYADARVELHKQLLDKHADNDDPEVQEKLAQDSEEVKSLPGITDEQIAELEGGESDQSEKDPEEDDLEDTDESVEGKDLELGDSDDITDDELAELKKHLKEMRKINKTLSENAKVGDRIVVNRDEDYYTDHGYKTKDEGHVVKKVENYGVFIDGYKYLIPHSDYKILPKEDK